LKAFIDLIVRLFSVGNPKNVQSANITRRHIPARSRGVSISGSHRFIRCDLCFLIYCYCFRRNKHLCNCLLSFVFYFQLPYTHKWQRSVRSFEACNVVGLSRNFVLQYNQDSLLKRKTTICICHESISAPTLLFHSRNLFYFSFTFPLNTPFIDLVQCFAFFSILVQSFRLDFFSLFLSF